MRYFILIITLFITTLSFSQGGKLIRIKVNKGETGATGPAGSNGSNGTDGMDGDDGREIELQNTGTYIQWRYVGAGSWTNLIDIDDITGPTGATGATGSAGSNGSNGTNGTNGADGADGSTWYDGAGAPSGGTGINGDYYLNDSNGDVYLKSGGSWSVVANIKGLDGTGAGTVTDVTGSAPIIITGTSTVTPNVTLDTTSSTGAGTQYDLTLKENKLTGVAGQTLRFSGTNTVSASNTIWNDGTSVGIGTTAPSVRLHVNGDFRLTGKLYDAYNNEGSAGQMLTNLGGYATEWTTLGFLDTLNGLIAGTQTFATGTSGTNFNISSSGSTHTFNFPNASGSNRGLLTTTDWTTFNGKENALTFNAPLSRSTNTISIPAATTSVSGHLTSTDWNTFNNKFTLPSLTSGSVLFSNGTTISQDNARFFWDNTNDKLGIGLSAATPTDRLTLSGYDGNDFIGLNNVLSTSNRTFKLLAGIDGVTYNGFSIYDTQAAATRMYISNTGNLGIGNSEDIYKLSVEGTFQVKTRTGTPSVGAAFDGVGKLVELSYLPLGGFGVVNKVAWYNTSNTTTFSNFFHWDESNRRLGVNTSTPTDRLTLKGYLGEDFIGLNNELSTNNRTFRLVAGVIGSSYNGFSIYDSFAAATRFYLSNAGLIGIGNISPNRTLEVTGEVRITDLTTDTPTSWVGSDGDGDLANGSVGNGIALSSGALGLTGQALAVHNLSSNGLIARTSSGNVSARTITAGNGIAVTNGDGVSGNPTIVSESSQYGQLFGNGQYSISETGSYTLFSSYTDASDDGSGNFTTNTGTGRITCNFTGTVKVSLTGYFIGDTDSGSTNLGLFKNASTGTFYSIIQCQNVVANTSYGQGFHGFILNVTSGDYFDTRYTNSITNQTVNQSLFLVQRIN